MLKVSASVVEMVNRHALEVRSFNGRSCCEAIYVIGVAAVKRSCLDLENYLGCSWNRKRSGACFPSAADSEKSVELQNVGDLTVASERHVARR